MSGGYTGRLKAITLNTLKENIRDKILYNLLIFALVLIILSISLAELTIGEQRKIVTDFGLASISIFGTLMAIFLGIGLVYKEIDRKSIYTLIAKPVSRLEFILGKFLGLLLTITINIAIMLVAYSGVLYYMGVSLNWALTQAVILVFIKLMIVTAAALLFSTFTTPTLSAIFTLSFFAIGHFVNDLKTFGAESKLLMFQWGSKALYYLIPNLSNYSHLGDAAHGIAMSNSGFLYAMASGVLTTCLILAIAILIFQRRDFV
jgi:Cu-processing system permease protein